MKIVKFFLTAAFLLSTIVTVHAQDLKTIKLSSPDMQRGSSLMTALSQRASAKDTGKWSDRELSQKDLSDLLWAANGINRDDSGKRTAGSAMNSQDVDIYVFLKEGVYLYDAAAHALTPLASGDHRSDIGMSRPAGAPAGAATPAPAAGQGGQPAAAGPGPGAGRASFDYPAELLIVSENARFPAGTAEKKYEWGCIDAGLVAQNIMLFCAGNGLVSHPKAGIDDDKMKTLLNLTDTQHCHLELPVGYAK